MNFSIRQIISTGRDSIYRAFFLTPQSNAKMNPFGDDRSFGIPGRSGKDAFDLVRWAPVAIRRLYRESECVNIYFNSATDGLVFNNDHKPIGLLNHRLSDNAIFYGEKFPRVEKN